MRFLSVTFYHEGWLKKEYHDTFDLFQLSVIVPLYLRLHWAYDYSLSYFSYLAFTTPSSYDYIVVGAGSAGESLEKTFVDSFGCRNSSLIVNPPAHMSFQRLLGGWPVDLSGTLGAFDRGGWQRPSSRPHTWLGGKPAEGSP